MQAAVTCDPPTLVSFADEDKLWTMHFLKFMVVSSGVEWLAARSVVDSHIGDHHQQYTENISV